MSATIARFALALALASSLAMGSGCASVAPRDDDGAARSPRREPFEAKALVLERGAPAWIVARDVLDRRVVLRSDDGGQRWRRFEAPGEIDGYAQQDLLAEGETPLVARANDVEWELAPVFDPHEARPTQWILWRKRGLAAVPIATLPDEAR